MTVTSPNSAHIALTYTKMRFDNFFDHTYPHHGHNCLNVLKVGWFSCPVRKVTPKYGSTVKNLTLRIFPKLFPVDSIYVGTMSFNFHKIFPWKFLLSPHIYGIFLGGWTCSWIFYTCFGASPRITPGITLIKLKHCNLFVLYRQEKATAFEAEPWHSPQRQQARSCFPGTAGRHLAGGGDNCSYSI